MVFAFFLDDVIFSPIPPRFLGVFGATFLEASPSFAVASALAGVVALLYLVLMLLYA